MPNHADLTGREKITLVYIRPPRFLWPILSEADNFLLPLAYPCLLAWIEKTLPGRVEQRILDCCSRKIGWNSLKAWLEKHKPDVVCIGEKTVYAHEAMRAFRLVKAVHPQSVTVAGGHHFSALPEWALHECPEIDYVIRYEGELPLESLLKALLEGTDLLKVPNLVFCQGARIVHTPLSPPLADLEQLPRPAYEKADIHLYNPNGSYFPGAITVQRGRGCIDTCKFCSWIALEARHEKKGNQVIHHTYYRSKSPEQVLDELEYLYFQYKRNFFKFVDATWNLDPKWLVEFSRLVMRSKARFTWWCYFRMDQFLEQEKLGVAEMYVRAGLRHVLVGVERVDSNDLTWLRKHHYGAEVAIRGFELLRKKYPEVFRHATFITGIRSDTRETIHGLLDLALRLGVDFASFHPLTPYPGTPLWEEAREKGWIEEWNFSKYDMFIPIMPTEHLSREEVARATAWCQTNFILRRPFRWWGRTLFGITPHRRRIHRWLTHRVLYMGLSDAVSALRGKGSFRGFAAAVNQLREPPWYES